MKNDNLNTIIHNLSTLGLGSLTLGPFQLNYPIEKGARLIAHAVNSGINLIDSAKDYRTYSYIARALELLPDRTKEKLFIIARSYDHTYEGMRESFQFALNSVNVNKLFCYMLHETESEHTIKGHYPAIEYLLEMKKAGKLDTIGISTHYIQAVKDTLKFDEIDVIFAILNFKGLGIMDGSRLEMEEALENAYNAGKIIFIMKAMGGGHLFNESLQALSYVKSLPFIHSTILGMQNIEEINYNLSFFKNKNSSLLPPILKKERKIFIEPWCVGCGNCVFACPFNALSLKENKAFVDESKCMLCSYCAAHCPDFSIKII